MLLPVYNCRVEIIDSSIISRYYWEPLAYPKKSLKVLIYSALISLQQKCIKNKNDNIHKNEVQDIRRSDEC